MIEDRFEFTDETACRNTLTAPGYAPCHEGFEDDNGWGTVRFWVDS